MPDTPTTSLRSVRRSMEGFETFAQNRAKEKTKNYVKRKNLFYSPKPSLYLHAAFAFLFFNYFFYAFGFVMLLIVRCTHTHTQTLNALCVPTQLINRINFEWKKKKRTKLCEVYFNWKVFVLVLHTFFLSHAFHSIFVARHLLFTRKVSSSFGNDAE